LRVGIPKLELGNETSVGIQEIDEQHKILIDLINPLFDETITGSGENKVNVILDELVQYTIVHFAFEEALFRIFDYPDIQIHTKHHVDLKKQVFDLQEKVNRVLVR
jgi:hemerythrin